MSNFVSRPIATTAVISGASVVARPLLTLVTLPMLLHALGVAGLGVWMIGLSAMGMAGFVNAGLSSAIVTAIGRSSASDDLKVISRTVVSALVVASAWGLVCALLLLPITFVADWHGLFGIGPDGPSAGDVRGLMLVLVVALAIGFVIAVPKNVMMGRQHGYVAHLLDMVGLLLGTAALVIALLLKQPLPVLAAALLGPHLIVLAIGGVVYLAQSGLDIGPASLDRPALADFSREGAKLSLYQASFAISSQSDLLLIGLVLGASASAGYGIAQRAFSLPLMLAAAVNYALWPALAKADAAGRIEWVRRTYRRTLLATVGGAAAAALLLAAVYEPLVGLWLGKAVVGDPLVIAGMVCWTIVSTFVLASDTLLRARRATSFITRQMVLMMVVNIVTSVVLLHVIGPAGAIFGSVIGFVTCLMVPYVIAIERIFRLQDVSMQGSAVDHKKVDSAVAETRW